MHSCLLVVSHSSDRILTLFFFFKQKTAYEMRISDWSSDVCSSDLNRLTGADVVAENKLFATLDPTTRRLRLPTNQNVLLSDTVGFIRKLPHRLVEAFKEIGRASCMERVCQYV